MVNGPDDVYVLLNLDDSTPVSGSSSRSSDSPTSPSCLGTTYPIRDFRPVVHRSPGGTLEVSGWKETLMRLTWRDGVETVLAGLTVAVAIAVTQEWSWPLLGSVGAGVVVLGVIGWAMCIFSGSTTSVPSMKDPFTIAMSVLGSGALALIVLGLVTKSEGVLVALAVVTVVMWLVSTTAHALTRKPNPAPYAAGRP
jgi:hypothetical protein